MRQKPNQIKLLNRLNHIRIGKVDQKDWNEINDSALNNLHDNEKKKFNKENPNLILFTETWDEANKYNYDILASLNVPVAVIPSTGRGRHHLPNAQLGQIPSKCVLACGSRVILTKNQPGLTSLGLNNGAIGTVKAIVFERGKSPPEFPQVIVVEFPKYRGQSWMESHPTWVLIPVNEARCEDNCCTRTGFPLIPAYGISIVKSQGTTIGELKQITHVIIKLNPETKMEKVNLGTAYTAFSRVCDDKDWCLAEKIPFERLPYINRHPQMEKRLLGEQQLNKLGNTTADRYSGTLHEYIKLLQEIDEIADDGIADSICNDKIDSCSCCIHKNSK